MDSIKAVSKAIGGGLAGGLTAAATALSDGGWPLEPLDYVLIGLGVLAGFGITYAAPANEPKGRHAK
jgi:hypothetical protein